jgi:phage repressor protein C with HTH and peptisase S24 domain
MSNTILPGAVPTVDWGPVERVEAGQIYIVRTEDAGLTVKRVYPDYQRKVLVCVSDNRAFPPFTLGPNEGGVVGRVLRWEQGET